VKSCIFEKLSSWGRGKFFQNQRPHTWARKNHVIKIYKNKMQMLSNTAPYTFFIRKTAVAIDLILTPTVLITALGLCEGDGLAQ
jgi:hypothetical protein